MARAAALGVDENGVAFLQVQPLATRYGLARPKALSQNTVEVGGESFG